MPIPLSVFKEFVLLELSCRPKHAQSHFPLPKYSFSKHYVCISNTLFTTKKNAQKSGSCQRATGWISFSISNWKFEFIRRTQECRAVFGRSGRPVKILLSGVRRLRMVRYVRHTRALDGSDVSLWSEELLFLSRRLSPPHVFLFHEWTQSRMQIASLIFLINGLPWKPNRFVRIAAFSDSAAF